MTPKELYLQFARQQWANRLPADADESEIIALAKTIADKYEETDAAGEAAGIRGYIATQPEPYATEYYVAKQLRGIGRLNGKGH